MMRVKLRVVTGLPHPAPQRARLGQVSVIHRRRAFHAPTIAPPVSGRC